MSGHTNLPSDPMDLPLLPLRDVVVFPHMVIPLFVGRPKSIKAMETAMEAGKSILLVAQRSAAKDDPGPEDMYAIGCVSNILQMLKLPDGTVKVLVEGGARAHIREVVDVKTHWIAEASAIPPDGAPPAEVEAMRRALLSAFDQYVKLNKKIPPEILTSISSIDDPGRLADTIAAHLPLKLEQKQQVLEMFDVKSRLEHLLSQLETEIDILQVEKRIRGRVKRQMEKNQRDFYLNEQVKAIQKELGEGEEGADIEEIEKKIKAAKMPKDARKKADAELKKLKLMSPMSAEATVVRNYIDTLVNLPWAKKTKIKHDLANAEAVLNEDHYGLDKIKERILEYLAVQQRVDKLKAPILCFVGPPGVGKTSLGESIARATGRKYVRMALGGVRDEAEIRGHRRTYIGSMPGASPTPSPRTCPSRSSRSRASSRPCRSPSAWRNCSPRSRTSSTSCRSRSASAAASSARWRRASASTTSTSRSRRSRRNWARAKRAPTSKTSRRRSSRPRCPRTPARRPTPS